MKLISSEERYRTPIFWVTQDRALDPDGAPDKSANGEKILALLKDQLK